MEEELSPILTTLGSLWNSRKLITGVSVLGLVLSIGISLLLPKWYAGTSRVLLPASPLGGLGALAGELSPIASSLLGGGGDYSRYIAILTSSRVTKSVINNFDLVYVYEFEDSAYPYFLASRELDRNVKIEVDLEYDFLSITVFDRDRERAAEMANYYVSQLNEVNAELESIDAASFRRYVEDRFNRAIAELDSARAAMQAFQEEHGVIELPAMAQTFLSSMAEQRATAARNEIEYQALLRQYGAGNPQVEAARGALEAARSIERRLMSGEDRLMPVALDELPALGNTYADLLQDILVGVQVLEVAQPLYEQALFQEEREKTAVQILDVAVPAERKAKPKRAIYVIAMTVSIFLLVCVFVIGRDWIRRNKTALARVYDQYGREPRYDA
ncbi:MAG: Wzz/FepE/Etk N-terminal domain-containing protein [Bacteroidota bacterium]